MFHQWIAIGVFSIVALAGVILAFFGIGGTFLVLAGAALYDLATWSWAVSPMALLWLAGLAVPGEIAEWLITVAGAKAKGVSGYGIFGTVLGAILGGALLSPVMPIVGTVLGIILGAMFGAFCLELLHKGDVQHAWQAAKAAFLGRALVSFCKTALAIVQIWLVLKDVF
jgi:uncharacterized protein YqgC (DUF456 family)